MHALPAGMELVTYTPLTDGHIRMQFAINGVLAPSIDDHRSAIDDQFRGDEDAWLTQRAIFSETLIHLFGDARNPLPESIVREREQKGF